MDARIKEVLDSQPVIDTHEHQSPVASILSATSPLSAILRRSYIGFFDFYPGFKDEFVQFDRSPDAWWDDYHSFKAFHDAFNEHEFKQCIHDGIKAVHGIQVKDINERDYNVLNAKIIHAYSTPGFRESTFRSNNIKHVILDIPYFSCGMDGEARSEYPGDFYMRSLRLNSFLFGFNPEPWTRSTFMVGQAIDLGIIDALPGSFNEYLDATAKILDWARDKVVSFKCASAYERTIDFGVKDDAQPGGNKYNLARKIFGCKFNETTAQERLAFGDVVFHFILDHVKGWGIPVQMHTGMAIMDGSHPRNFAPVLASYPGITFTLLHCGYPWIEDTLELVASHENAYAEMVWLPMLSRAAARAFFARAVQKSLTDKVVAFGGDCGCVEGTIGALSTLKACMCDVFEDMVRKGMLETVDIEGIARPVLFDNPRDLFLGHGKP